MRKPLLFAALAALSACMPTAGVQVTKARPNAAQAAASLAAPAFVTPTLQGAPVPPRGHSAADLSSAFMELAFALESGRPLPVFSRFEGPITVALAGDIPGTAAADLAVLLARLRSEAGIDIALAEGNSPASVTVHFETRRNLRRAAANAACFVVPNVADLDAYQASRGSAKVDWTTIRQRRSVAIFAPSDASPQELRDCLHEELAQAIGPLNDLYRLSDSVFNDDNFQSILTSFDMKILRAYYAPELHSGMSKPEVAAKIGAIMATLAPAAAHAPVDASPTPRIWVEAITAALSDGGRAARLASAERAIAIARAQGWQDARLAFSHFVQARLLVPSDRGAAVAAFTQAAALYRTVPGGALHVAHIDMQLAAIALASGQPEQALRFTERAIPVIRSAQNHALLATTLLIRAQALEKLGRSPEAGRLRVDSAAPARYGFGSEAQVRARTREIMALGSPGLLRG